MRKIKTRQDMNIPGWGFIPKDTPFKVIRFNKRFVYVEMPLSDYAIEHGVTKGATLRLARKRDCVILY